MAKIKTFIELLEHGKTLFGELDAFRIRNGKSYDSITFNQYYEDCCNLAASLESRSLGGLHIAVVGENSYEWVLAYIGTVVSGGVIIPIDKDLSLAEVSMILKESGAKALFCSEDFTEDFADELKKEIPIEYFSINSPDSNNYTTLRELLKEGEEIRKQNPSAGQNEQDDESVASIVFTSGTTGFSKGVLLTRRNLITNVESSDDLIKTLGNTLLSLLPMHHTYEFTLGVLFAIYQGRAVGINDSIKYLMQNIQLFAPTDMLIVPLIADNLLKGIWQTAEKQKKDKKLKIALKISNLLLKLGIDLRRKLFKDIHNSMGGRLNGFFIGGALLDEDTARGLYELGFRVSIGYGITECSPLVTGNITDRLKYFGSCGVAIPGVEIRLDNPNELGEGEIQVKGDSVMVGYFNNPEATAATMDGEWFKTGDIGRIKDGMLYITGRVKNLIVLKNGKNIYPEELEMEIGRIPQVAEVIVRAGDSKMGEEVSIIAEVFPDLEKYTAPQQEIRQAIEELNDKLPYYKRIVDIKFRDIEFPKTTSRKIKRY